ncbi:hypothetical protein BGZ94_003981, partial [Podila epigama]
SDEKLNKFSMAELRDLFTFHEDEVCLTHSLLECDCGTSSDGSHKSNAEPGKSGRHRKVGILNSQSESIAKKELQGWRHFNVSEAFDHAYRNNDKENESRLSDNNRSAEMISARDGILWKTICGEGRSVEAGKLSHGRDGQEEHIKTIGFVFVKSSIDSTSAN